MNQFLLTITIIHLFTTIGAALVSSMYESHEHSYPILFKYANMSEEILFTDDYDHMFNPNETKSSNNCSQNFPNCLCSPDPVSLKYALYCNDPNLKRIPPFSRLLNTTSLIFSKVDFSQSGIQRIYKNDLRYLNLDLRNSSIQQKQKQSTMKELSSHVLYHLDFEAISEIETGAFEWFGDSSDELHLLKIRFSNSHFSYGSLKPFKGLSALKFHLNNISNEYLLNTMFDESRIVELLIENMHNFIGFLDFNNFPSGHLLNRFVAIRSYKIDSLCSHALPSFVHQEFFSEISIKKCSTLKAIKPFTFFKYPHLKQLFLTSNSFTSIYKNSLSHLTQLELLDLSYNPIDSIEDMSFKDLSSLKRLYLESTLIKVIQQNTLTGLVALSDLKFSKTKSLQLIDAVAFKSFANTLKYLSLKDTNVSLIESVMIKSEAWLEDLSLHSLNLESSLTYEQFELNSNNKTILCKLKRYLTSATLIHLQRSQPCNCLVYFIYRDKNFIHDPYWEFKTPVCYRSQIEFFKVNNSRSFQKINEKEFECNLDSIDSYCNGENTVIHPFVSTTDTLITSTSTIGYSGKQISVKPTKYFPASPRTKTNNLPKLDFRKLFKVLAVIIFITIFSILCTIIILRYSRRVKKQKRSYQINRLNKARARTNKLVLPPLVVPSIDINLISSKLKTASPTVSRV